MIMGCFYAIFWIASLCRASLCTPRNDRRKQQQYNCYFIDSLDCFITLCAFAITDSRHLDVSSLYFSPMMEKGLEMTKKECFWIASASQTRSRNDKILPCY
jgi:hypothetical protein